MKSWIHYIVKMCFGGKFLKFSQPQFPSLQKKEGNDNTVSLDNRED